MTVEWVGGHIGLEGNEFADFLADKGAGLSAKGSGMEDYLDFIGDFGFVSGGTHVQHCVLTR